MCIDSYDCFLVNYARTLEHYNRILSNQPNIVRIIPTNIYHLPLFSFCRHPSGSYNGANIFHPSFLEPIFFLQYNMLGRGMMGEYASLCGRCVRCGAFSNISGRQTARNVCLW